jgi:CDP-paratose 2-epimerase
VARLTGIYGERQTGSEDHGWVANFAIRTLCEKPYQGIRHDKQCRDILHVKDAAQAFLNCTNKAVFQVFTISAAVHLA